MGLGLKGALGLVVAATMAAATPAAAQVVASGDSIASVLRDRGYQAELTKDSDGDPMIRSGAGGSKFIILFMGCTNNKGCTSIQFYAGFKSSGSTSVGKMNDWNRTKRFARGYIDNDGDPVVEMDIDLDEGGMSRALFQDNLAVWVAALDAFKKHIG